jgi:superfamily II DNA/RNA helicase
VGTAGRVLELITKRKINAQTIKTIVIDEADRLLDANNLDGVKAVIKTTQRDRQIILVSATISPLTVEKAKKLMKAPKFIKAETAAQVPDTIEHIYVTTELRDKIDTLRKLVFHTQAAKALVFINVPYEINKALETLTYHGVLAESLHGEDKKMERKNTLEKFRAGKTQVLIASDLAARGLDIKDVTHVFNMDVPESTDAYLHRVGRTGRTGKAGMAISLVAGKELNLIKKHAQALGLAFKHKELVRGSLVDVRVKENK